MSGDDCAISREGYEDSLGDLFRIGLLMPLQNAMGPIVAARTLNRCAPTASIPQMMPARIPVSSVASNDQLYDPTVSARPSEAR